MARTITNYMLGQEFQKTIQNTNNAIQNATSSNNGQNLSEIINIEEKTINKVNNQYLICTDGTIGQLFAPLPGVFWKCLCVPDTNGVATLTKPLTGLFISVGDVSYCLGVCGDTDEFELRSVHGNNEVRLNKTFLNISSEHIVKNGIEETKP